MIDRFIWTDTISKILFTPLEKVVMQLFSYYIYYFLHYMFGTTNFSLFLKNVNILEYRCPEFLLSLNMFVCVFKRKLSSKQK